ncbi:SLATT domain-containing protein [Bradyrhizobium yuanmingense]|uniref:SLATT domain-containing protein n=1 Tax=Bradyrhizobium yuanmingense TaxID=108015 RepID=UPI00351515CD
MTEQHKPKTVLETALVDFKRSAETTRDVRFQANLRLSGRERGSSYIVSLLSLYVIGLSLIPNIVELKPFQSQILLGCSIVLSVFVIFTSLIDGAQNFFHPGELLHQCARTIAVVHHALKTIDVSHDPGAAKLQLETLQKDYQSALDECPINHENVDFYKEIASKPHLFPQQYNSILPRSVVSFGYRVLYLTLGKLWVAPHLAAFAAISVVVYFAIFIDPHLIGK